MTRVFGRLFPDGRNGILAITPSRPFLGAERDEGHYEVIDGEVDFELLPTPRGIYYNVGFKRLGDTRRSIYSAQWSVPHRGELDVTPKPHPSPPTPSSAPMVYDSVHTKRLATELSHALSDSELKDQRLLDLQSREDSLQQHLESVKQLSEQLLRDRDRQLSALQEQIAYPEVKTVVREVPVPPTPLEERIKHLESENSKLHSLCNQYHEAVVELHQLKLERAQTEQPSDPVHEVPVTPGTPQQRLFQKLQAK